MYREVESEADSAATNRYCPERANKHVDTRQSQNLGKKQYQVCGAMCKPGYGSSMDPGDKQLLLGEPPSQATAAVQMPKATASMSSNEDLK